MDASSFIRGTSEVDRCMGLSNCLSKSSRELIFWMVPITCFKRELTLFIFFSFFFVWRVFFFRYGFFFFRHGFFFFGGESNNVKGFCCERRGKIGKSNSETGELFFFEKFCNLYEIRLECILYSIPFVVFRLYQESRLIFKNSNVFRGVCFRIIVFRICRKELRFWSVRRELVV